MSPSNPDRFSVLEQIQSDFAADTLRVDGYYLYVGERTRAFINIDADEVFTSRAESNRGRNYLVFLSVFLYNRFGLLPVPDSLSHRLITQVEAAKAQRFHARMQDNENGVGFYEFWDGKEWCIRAVPATDPDFRSLKALPDPNAPGGPDGKHYSRRGRWDPLPGKEEAIEPLEELEEIEEPETR